MQQKKTLDSQFDLFVPFMSDVSLRDTQETMERPFFSLSKGRRVKPIEYTSPDGTVFVKVSADAEYGMATIWDADILIWAASVMNAQKRKYGENDLGRTLNFQPYDLLRTIGRRTGGREYLLLRDALGRLQATTIRTNIRQIKKRDRQFSWIESWTDLQHENGESAGMQLTVSEWFYEGIVQDKNLLSIDPAYFSIRGGRERWLYRVARKHAGGNGPAGYAIPLPTLFEKSGAEGKYKRFKFEMLDIAKRSQGPDSAIPGFDVLVEQGRGKEPSLRMIRQGQPADIELVTLPPKKPARPTTAQRSLPLSAPPPNRALRQLTDQTIANVRRDFPRWDVYAIKADYDEWLDTLAELPDDYNAAFYGFARKWCARQAG